MEFDKKNLNRSTLSIQIANQLKENIVNGKFQVGSFLPSENKLSEIYSISRPIIREALKYLAAQGFIKIINGKGAKIEGINNIPLQIFFQRALSADPNSWLDLMKVRKILEIESVSLASQFATDKEIHKLGSIIKNMRKKMNDYSEYSLLDVKFHISIAELSKNSFLYHLISTIRYSLVVIMDRLRNELTPQQLPFIQNIHENIYISIKNKDVEKSKEAMTIHFDDVISRIKKYFSQ